MTICFHITPLWPAAPGMFPLPLCASTGCCDDLLVVLRAAPVFLLSNTEGEQPDQTIVVLLVLAVWLRVSTTTEVAA